MKRSPQTGGKPPHRLPPSPAALTAQPPQPPQPLSASPDQVQCRLPALPSTQGLLHRGTRSEQATAQLRRSAAPQPSRSPGTPAAPGPLGAESRVGAGAPAHIGSRCQGERLRRAGRCLCAREAKPLLTGAAAPSPPVPDLTGLGTEVQLATRPAGPHGALARTGVGDLSVSQGHRADAGQRFCPALAPLRRAEL